MSSTPAGYIPVIRLWGDYGVFPSSNPQTRNEPREQDIKHFKLMSKWGDSGGTGSKIGMAISDAYYQMGCHMVGCSFRDSDYINKMKKLAINATCIIKTTITKVYS